MADTDDLIEQILQESKTSDKLEYDPNKYDVDALLKEETIPKMDTVGKIDKLTNLEQLEKEKENQPTFDPSQLDNLISSTIAPPTIKKEEPAPPKKPLKKEEKEELLELPKYDNSIDLVNFIEIESTQKRIEKSKSSFILQNYKQECKLKVNSLEIEPQIELSRVIFKQKNIVLSCMGARNDMIITGNTIGEIKFYSLKEMKLIKTLTDKSLQFQVNCFDFTEDGKFMLVGYSNGYLGLFDIIKDKHKYTVNDIHFKSCIAIRFFKKDEKLYHFFSSDTDGNVFCNILKDGTFRFSIKESKNLFTQNKTPTYLIKFLSFSEEEKKAFEFLENVSKAVIFASIGSVQIYTIEPEVKKLWSFEKPSYIRDNLVPDATIGIGKPPISLNIKSDNIKSQLLLAIAWGRVIYIFLIPVLKNLLSEPTLLGYFVNSKQILRMGFLTNSLIYFFDETKFIKVIDTRQINVGNLVIDQELNEPIIPPTNNDAQLDDGRLVDPEVQSQYLFEDKDKKPKATYLNYIVENKNVLHLLGKQTLYNGKLLNWETCLNNLKKDTEEEWMDLLTKGIEIFQARMPALADIPQDEETRKSVVGNYLKQVISQYVLFNTGAKRTGGFFSEDQDETDKMATCISNTIEFCIEIESFDYLFTTIEPIFDSKDYSDLFLSQLEPFILCDKIMEVQLQEEIINNIIDLYRKKKKLELLAQLLIHLNIKSVDTENIKSKCEEMSLITPLIYIYMNGKDEDYFAPITKMFDQYLKAIEIDHFDGYYKFYEKTKNLSELKKSKQYLGHKLLWYIKWCLKGKKFPNPKINMDRDKYHQAISKITYWLLTQKVFLEFVRFDHANYFDILNQLFSNEKLYKIINEASTNNDEKISALATLYNESFKLNDVEPYSLIKYLVNQCDVYPDEKIKLLANELVAKASKLTTISKDLSMKTIEFIFSKYQTKKNIGAVSSLINPILNKTEDELIILSNDIISLLDDDTGKYDELNYRGLLQKGENTPFDIVKLFLTKKVKEYRLTLELYLDDYSRIPDKLSSMFSWINMTLSKLKDKDKSEYERLKTNISNNIGKIGKLSVNEMYSMVNLWFQKEKQVILLKLEESPEIQLQYIEIGLQKLNANLQENENNIEEDEPGQIASLLRLHIKLLCQLGYTKKILPNLKKNPLYPLDECLKLCLEYNVSDAAIYLYQATGDSAKALEMSLRIFEDKFIKISNNLRKEKEFSENIHTLLLQEMQNDLLGCINVCEHNEQQNDKLWFSLLDTLYRFFGEISVKKESNEKMKNHYGEVEATLSNDIKELLEKMCSFVSIKGIIDEVTKRFKTAEFREFKELLLKMLYSYSNQTKILDSAKQLLSNSVIINENDLIKLSMKGNDFVLKNCDICGIDFKKTTKKENIVVFKCGHIMHQHCSALENDEGFECKICRKNEIESSVSTYSRSTSRSSDTNDISNNPNSNLIMDDNEERSEEKMAIFHKLKEFDKRNLQTKKMLIENSINLFRNHK